ncbi:sensor histidine kinase [Corynebacterium uterequi]|uniref:histidine kinase n=1 Tax=Corynebacterium uterequi TaxID=1072256 RepID=A0A0G3HHU4_9CORY|nr:HAMP domain-containing sensor histidine kinase [Corynebacterium uterequi]AKK10697.1 histidine kinase,HAMP domain-containing protein,histidine kinase [Corynebacterium uterequi]
MRQRSFWRPLSRSDLSDTFRHTTSGSLWWRMSLLTILIVVVAAGAQTLMILMVADVVLTRAVDDDLRDQAATTMAWAGETNDPTILNEHLSQFHVHNPGYEVSIVVPVQQVSLGDVVVPATGQWEQLGELRAALSTSGDKRVITVVRADGFMVSMARDLTAMKTLRSGLHLVLLVIFLLAVALAFVAGFILSIAGLRPLRAFEQEVVKLTEDGRLRPVPVRGNNEVSQLTKTFNRLVYALIDSQQRQARLVADAGHELKTPLTSMRTNIELLMMVSRSRDPSVLSTRDREELENDVISQLEEFSSLIGDLVDLSRVESHREEDQGDVGMEEIIGEVINRIRRRRPDVSFVIDTEPWVVHGEAHSLSRALTNLLDNAAKWSPAGGDVTLQLRAINDEEAELTVTDHGPGISDVDKPRVFDRFYRSPEARAMPGSGLGLAIVQQVIHNHGGAITVLDADGGGTVMRVVLPGHLPGAHEDIDVQ